MLICNQTFIVLSRIDSHLTPRRSVWYFGGRAAPRLRWISRMTMVMGCSAIETTRLAAVYSPLRLADILSGAGEAFWEPKAETEKPALVHSHKVSQTFSLICESVYLLSFSVRSLSFQLCCCCRCATRAAGGSITWV